MEGLRLSLTIIDKGLAANLVVFFAAGRLHHQASVDDPKFTVALWALIVCDKDVGIH